MWSARGSLLREELEPLKPDHRCPRDLLPGAGRSVTLLFYSAAGSEGTPIVLFVRGPRTQLGDATARRQLKRHPRREDAFPLSH